MRGATVGEGEKYVSTTEKSEARAEEEVEEEEEDTRKMEKAPEEKDM